uniref:Reverse transcriptase domain-containing protein n=1 Tax=Solanum lycopersicum TaxID=4081 RepID=A0A3Q7EY30_SOLLC
MVLHKSAMYPLLNRNQMDAYFEHVNMPSKAAKIRTAAMYLSDTAMLWWRMKMADTEKGLKREFKCQFHPQNVVHEARRRLRELKQTSSIRDYVKEFKKLTLQILSLTSEDLLFYFLDGLQNWAKQELQRRPVHDVDKAIVVAESLNDFRVDAAKGRDNRSKIVPPKVDNNINKGRPSPNQGSNTKGNTRDQPYNFCKSYEDQKKGAPHRGGCYIFGETTHAARYCTTLRKLSAMVAAEKQQQKAATQIGGSAGEQHGQNSRIDKGKNKKDGTLQLCIDYRALNKVTVKNKCPIPLIAHLFDRFGQAKVFTKMDLRKGYYQVRIAEGDELKTTRVTRYAAFEWLVMPFGLTNASATFCTLMNKLFHPYLDQFVVIYLDDIVHEGSCGTLCKVFKVLRDNDLCVKQEKCSSSQPTVQFLGHTIIHAEIRMDGDKVKAIQNWEAPTKVPELRYSDIADPLTDLLKKNREWEWSDALELSKIQVDAALKILKRRKKVIGWNMVGITLTSRMHKIIMEDNHKPSAQHQR